MNIEDYYRSLCDQPSDIREHLPVLRSYAAQCHHVTEFGTRSGRSTAALLAAQPNCLISYDVTRHPNVDRLTALRAATEFHFMHRDVLCADIADTDLLFVDTLHNYHQVRQELARHGGRVSRYLIFHDVETFGLRDERPGADRPGMGIVPAILEYLCETSWGKVVEWRKNSNGLLVVERRVKSTDLAGREYRPEAGCSAGGRLRWTMPSARPAVSGDLMERSEHAPGTLLAGDCRGAQGG
jgi:hypothetical protein